MSGLVLLIIVAWVAINGFVIYKGLVFMRKVNQLQPELDNVQLSQWIREKEMPGDVPEGLRPYLSDLRQWRAIGRRYFLAAMVALLGLFGLEAWQAAQNR